MWIVQLALRRPYTFIVAALLLLIAGPVAILRTPVDIFPNIDIPVMSVVFQYTGLSSSEFEGRITSSFERVLTTTVNDIEHIEIAVAERHRGGQDFLPAEREDRHGARAGHGHLADDRSRQLPPGTTPPLIITLQRLSVPILQLGLSSDNALASSSSTTTRSTSSAPQLATVPGAAIPYPYRRQAARR